MNSASPPLELTRDQFLAGVRASGVLTDRQFEKAEQSVVLFHKSARDAADHLVTGDWLTRFQAERLLLGRADGFLLGPYVILDPLAKTAAGRVFRARHRTMNRTVAVLVLRAELCGAEAVRETIRAQARNAARLAHPNVLTLLDVNTAGDRMYLVHEYVCGADAAALVRAGGPLSVPRACAFTRQAADGLQHAHDKQMPHGRLTPAAVLVGRPGGNGPHDKPVVKVAGLGLGRFTDAGETADGYTAPELAANPTPTPAADLYALGGVFHFLLTGSPPNPTAPIARLRPDLPPPLAAVLAALLHPDPARRPASAADVGGAMAAFAADESALIDFSLPASGPASAATLPTGLSGGHLPLAVPVSAPTPPPAPSPFAELVESDEADDDDDDNESADTPLSGRAVNTPVQTVRRRATRRRAAHRPANRGNRPLWLGLAGAAVVLALAGASLALLLNVLKG